MKLLLFTCIVLWNFSFCVTKQTKSKENSANNMDSNSRIQKVYNENISIQDSKQGIIADTLILGVPYYRIDSLKLVGIKNGGRPSGDTILALYLRLTDSTRLIGPYTLDYIGQEFKSLEYNAKKPNQVDVEIVEERNGIVSVQKRLFNKPDYFPLLDQQIEFYNKQNRLLNTFNINKNNPFLKDKSKKVMEHMFPPPDDKSEKLSLPGVNWKVYVNKYYSYNRFNVQENGYVIVEYKLFAMDANEGILNSISTLVVLDSTGKEYARFNELENMLHYYWLVSGGKHLIVNGGGILGEGFQRLEKSFLKIYEVASRKLIYEETQDLVNDDYSNFYESEPPIKISVSFGSYKKNEKRRFTELIFNLDARQRCIKVISQLDWNRITNERIKYSGNVWLREFEFDCKTF